MNPLDKSRFGNDRRNQFLNVSLDNDLLLGEFVSSSATQRCCHGVDVDGKPKAVNVRPTRPRVYVAW